MKIYVDEESQEARVDFGEKDYVRVALSPTLGGVVTEVCPASWLPDVLGDSEPVYETPEPGLEWPTKPNALVEARTLYWTQERFIRQGDYWATIEGGTEFPQEELELKRIIFEGEDTQ